MRALGPGYFAGAKFRDDRWSVARSIVARGVAVGDGQARAVERQLRVRAGVGERQDLPAQVLAGQPRGIAGHERLPRGRGLAGVGRQVGVADHHAERARRQAQRVGGDLQQHRGGALADVDRAVEEGERAVARQRDAHGRRVRQRGVAAAVPHAGDADAAPAPRARSRCGAATRASAASQSAFSASRHCGRPAECVQHLARGRGIAVVERIDAADGPAVEAEPLGQVVHQRLVGDGRLRHAEAAEGAGRRVVGVDGARAVARRWAPCRVPCRAPARGWRPSAPTTRRRRC